MNLEDIVQRTDQLIEKADEVLQTHTKEKGQSSVDTELFRSFRAASLSFLARTFGEENVYYTEFNSGVSHSSLHYVRIGRGILLAVREELAGGWVVSARGLVSAEIFADFLEMAQHLLDEGYKDPAAVVAGSVLEEHLRQLCEKHKIDVVQDGSERPKKADTLNSELGKGKSTKSSTRRVSRPGWISETKLLTANMMSTQNSKLR